MEHVVVTGAGGFVGRRLVDRLVRSGKSDLTVESWARSAPGELTDPLSIDITDRDAVAARLKKAAPTALFHLAAFSQAPNNTSALERMWRANLDGSIFVAEELLAANPEAWMFLVSSGMVYGDRPGQLLTEQDPVAPSTAYAASKYAAETALRMLIGRGLKLCILRPFNHSGPGQASSFFVPALIQRILMIERGEAEGVLSVRNAHHVRDFLHVDDVVEFYTSAWLGRDRLRSGEIFNVCSGVAVTVLDIAEFALSISEAPDCPIVKLPSAPEIGEVTAFVGDNAQARDQFRWSPAADWKKMVSDTYVAMKGRGRLHSRG